MKAIDKAKSFFEEVPSCMGIIILSDLYAMVCLSGEAHECTSLHDTFPNRQSYSVY